MAKDKQEDARDPVVNSITDLGQLLRVTAARLRRSIPSPEHGELADLVDRRVRDIEERLQRR